MTSNQILFLLSPEGNAAQKFFLRKLEHVFPFIAADENLRHQENRQVAVQSYVGSTALHSFPGTIIGVLVMPLFCSVGKLSR